MWAGIELRLKDADGFILFDNECDGFTEVGLRSSHAHTGMQKMRDGRLFW